MAVSRWIDDRDRAADLVRRVTVDRPVALGIADALLIGLRRARDQTRFTRYEGFLSSPEGIARIARTFGPDYPFSPSQLESLVSCPFQFFLRYVLRLDPVEDRDELEEDSIGRGQVVHSVLEEFHRERSSLDEFQDIEFAQAANNALLGLIESHLGEADGPVSDIERGLRRIEAGRFQILLRKYFDQLGNYLDGPRRLEVAACEYRFGPKEGNSLRLGDDATGILLQGKIDRVDQDGAGQFRVIDYKTNSAPSKADLEKGIALQLPLYALAVSRDPTIVPGLQPAELAYWTLRTKGYKAVHRMGEREDWGSYSERLVRYVLDAVDRLRAGEFPVRPRRKDCERHCEYSRTCRLHQIDQSARTWPDAPVLEGP